MKALPFLLLFAMFSVSCKKHNGKDPDVLLSSSTMNNVSYGSSSQQTMDIFLPANRNSSSTKTIVLIHGGAWMGGDKADMSGFVTEMKNRFPDYAVININYRLVNGSNDLFPAQELDTKAAIDHYLSKAADFKVSNDLVLFGLSAGAHLSLLHAYKNDPSGHVKAVVDAFGPTDLPAMYNLNATSAYALTLVTGSTYNANPAIYNESSPIQYVGPQTPPTIVLQGGADTTVDPSQSTSLITALSQAGVVNQYVYYPNEAHGWGGFNLIDSFNKIEAFIDANVD